MKTPFLALCLLGTTLLSPASAQDTPPAETPPKWKKLEPAASTPEGLRFSKHVIATYAEHAVELLVYSPELPGKYPPFSTCTAAAGAKRQSNAIGP